MRKYSNDKDLNKFIQQIIKMGVVSYKQGKKHNFIFVCDSTKIAIPGTPSDRRAYLNFKTDIHRVLKCQKIHFQQV